MEDPGKKVGRDAPAEASRSVQVDSVLDGGEWIQLWGSLFSP